MDPAARAENQRRIYSAAYQEGQRLSRWPANLEKADDDLAWARTNGSSRWRRRGVHAWVAGFRDGFHGRPPRRQLRLADLPEHQR